MKEKCIIWNGFKWAQGRYGKDTIDGKSMGAHRAAWIRLNGKIPKGLVVCHKCDNGLCVNVDHLFLGTPSDNMKDCKSKGRLVLPNKDQSGKNNNNARADYEERRILVKKLRSSGQTYSQIKKKIGIKSSGHLWNLLTS